MLRRLFVILILVSCAIFVQLNDSLEPVIKGLLTALLTGGPLVLAESRLYATEQSVKKRFEAIRVLLPTTIKGLFQNPEFNVNEDIASIRANIMYPGLSIWPWKIKRSLKMITTYNMEAHKATREDSLVWESGKGACGWLLYRVDEHNSWNPVAFDRSKVTDQQLRDSYFLNEEEIAATAHIRWAISIPIVLAKKGRAPLFLGVLNIDSTLPLKDLEILMDQDFHARAQKWGENLAVFFEDNSLVLLMRRKVRIFAFSLRPRNKDKKLDDISK